ncbi:SDR family NAD(P)-dependent oxidoreductase [Mycobacterium asiaticum]|uniref:Short-chain dehydrogenase n=1 Tax=Mycobacterium asiaticum TaxID=1790 RepID=A0A1A3N611_MYCAS|nr:SDR family NAD(P)-dependent oxidoreductase [Mycobacterium asiaticum]OBK17593.1 short-chain dehydrogenase [Mycobacterium asiaticum]
MPVSAWPVSLLRGQGRSAKTKAVVTGAGSGIGRSFALELARRGGEVICADIDAERALATAELINQLGRGRGYDMQCDVSDRSAIELLAKQAQSVFDGAPTLVINNAGVGIGGKPVGEIGIEDWAWALSINLWGVVYGCEVFTPILREAGRGGIINVASAAGFAAAPSMAAYNVSKAGVMSLSETLAAELQGTGIKVTVLCPTFVKTNVFQDGRITPGSMSLSQQLARWTGLSADNVAVRTLDAHDRGRLYVVPQIDARLIWRLKRYFPGLFVQGAGLLGRILPQD